MRWLVSDWDNRDPQDDLHNIDDGKYFEGLSRLRDSHRQMLEDSEMRIELKEIDGKYYVTKIVKKREPEYLQTTKSFFVLDKEGKRVYIDEEEWERITGGTHNPEDVYNVDDVEFVGLEEHTAPMDVWDVIFDATQYITEAQQFIQAYNEGRIELSPGETPIQRLQEMQDELIYSADWFPYPVDKRLKNPVALQIAAEIDKGLSRGQLAYRLRRLRRNRSNDTQREDIEKMIKYADKLPPGPERAYVRKQAQRLKEQMYTNNSEQHYEPTLSNSDRRKLWDMWRERELRVNGKCMLTSWQFEALYRVKLQRLGVDRDTANSMVAEAMERVYKKRPKNIQARQNRPSVPSELPEWLTDVPTPEYMPDEDDYEELVNKYTTRS